MQRVVKPQRPKESDIDPRTFDYSAKIVQETMTHEKRIEVLYHKNVHNMTLHEISAFADVPYSTLRQAINEFKKTQRTNKLLP